MGKFDEHLITLRIKISGKSESTLPPYSYSNTPTNTLGEDLTYKLFDRPTSNDHLAH
jgi:hypothetical protein